MKTKGDEADAGRAALCPDGMKGRKTVKRLLSCLLVLALAIALVPSVLADGDALKAPKARIGDTTYATLQNAVNAVPNNTPTTIYLGEGEYTLYEHDGIGANKDLTFIGMGADKTSWRIGAVTPDPTKLGTEYNSDYSFRGSYRVVFKNMTLVSYHDEADSKKDYNYLGFAHTHITEVEDCVINGLTFYWGYQSASFKNTTFNCPKGDYAVWTYSSPTMSFDHCVFNSSGKVINVYHEAKADPYTINFSDCTVNNTGKALKQVMNINDSTGQVYTINISGDIVIKGTAILNPDTITCSRLFGFDGKKDNNGGNTEVKFNGTPVWKDGKMVDAEAFHNHGVWVEGVSYTNSVDGANDSLYAEGYKDNAFTVSNATEWVLSADGTRYTRTSKRVCDYCGYAEEGEETGYKLSYDLNGGTGADGVSYDGEIIAANHAVKVKAAPTLSGTSFTGWNTARDGSGTRYDADASIIMTANVTLYAQWEQGSSASGFAFPVGDEHIAYVSGYPDGTVRPEANITRAESAAMLYRLMPRGYFASGAQTPADVTTSDWYYSIVSQMVGSGYLTGYADGTFRGNNNVTRAEFVTMLVRLSGARGGWCSFTDVSASHWAYDAISTAAAEGWIGGYADGSFRPDQAITRAEAMTIINRALDRGVDETSWLGDYINWPDNPRDAWYYYEVIEATNDHYYTGSRPSEDWVG